MKLRRSLSPLLLPLLCCATAPEQTKPSAQAVPAPAGILVAPQGATPTPPLGLRLPATFKAVAQRVELTLVPSADGFEGTTDLDVELATASDILWLNAKELVVKKASARQGDTASVAQVFLSPERVALFFPHPLAPGRATLHLEFTGLVSKTDDSGIFHQQEGGDWYVMTQFEETDARRAFPCVDEPSSKIPWEVTLKVPKELVAVSNTPIASTEPAGEGMKRVHFARTKPLPPYLVAFAVGPYDFLDARPAGVNKVPMRIYTPRGRASEAAYAARTSPEILEALENYFGIPYPYEKLDLLAIPLTLHFGAMENAGLVTVASGRLLARKENESVYFQQVWATYAAHEFAHQWFGDFVTLAWWNDIWLNEAFASWMENNIVDAWAPKWGFNVVEVTDRSTAANADTLVTARSIRQPIETYGDIENAFDNITYDKGAAVIRMFETYLGKAQFQKGVQLYLRAHAYGNATSADFLAAISEATGQDVAPAFDTFLNQSGVPELTVQLSCGRGKKSELGLAQQRLLPVGSTATEDRSWQVPVCVRWAHGGKESRSCMLLTTPSATMALEGTGCPDWVLPNADYAGYYRLNLKGSLLKTLVARGRKALTTPETVGLLGDVQALVKAGRFPEGDGMELSTQFAGASERPVVEQAILLANVRPDFLQDAAQKVYPAWVRRNFGARARALGMQARPGETEDNRLLRAKVVAFDALRGEDPPLIASAQETAARWLKDPTSVDPDMEFDVLRISGAFGGQSFHDALVERLKATSDRATRGILLIGLGAFRQPALVKANLTLLEDSSLDPRELIRAFSLGALPWPGPREVLFQAVVQDFDRFASYLPERSVAKLFTLGASFCDTKHRAQVDAAFAPRADKALGGKRDFAQTLEAIDLCIAARAVQEPSISRYLAHAPH